MFFPWKFSICSTQVYEIEFCLLSNSSDHMTVLKDGPDLGRKNKTCSVKINDSPKADKTRR